MPPSCFPARRAAVVGTALGAILALAALLAPNGARAQAAGDAAAGAALFDRQCVSCHVVRDPSGEVLAGRSARTGPNLFGVAGRVPGTEPDFAYSDAMVAYGGTGAHWSEETFVPYLQGPTDYLRTAIGDPRARSKMAYQVRDEQEARDLWAFLATFAPAGSGGSGGSGGEPSP